jgi:hypothetical protein
VNPTSKFGLQIEMKYGFKVSMWLKHPLLSPCSTLRLNLRSEFQNPN